MSETGRRIFITGRGGALVSALLPLLPGDRTYATTSTEAGHSERTIKLDLCEPKAFDYDLVSVGDVVLHLAAVSAPDFCRDQPERAWAINVDGTSYFIERCLRRGASVFFFSSDAVYPATAKCLLDEDSPCAALEPYGRMKQAVEEYFMGSYGFHVLRLSYVVSPFDKFTRYLAQCMFEGREAEIIAGFRRSAVAFTDVAAVVLHIIGGASMASPVINLCGPQTLSRLEMAEAFRHATGSGLHLREIPAPSGFFDSRPREIRLSSKYLSSTLGRTPIAIADYYKKLTKEGLL